jgi:amidohydrolase
MIEEAERPMTDTFQGLRADIDEILPGVIADRRWLHEHPELGMQEFETSAFVADRLRAMNVESIRTGIAVTGITALVRGTRPAATPGKVALIRADMDALPILEENQVDYVSKTAGVMHACGHDAHTAMLLGVTRLLMDRRDQFSGTVKVLFQPAEEGPGGAEPMIEAGVLEDPHVDAVFGLHVAQETPVGHIALRGGPSMASADSFHVRIQGKGGHGARPQGCIDPIVVAAHIVTALQTIVSREVDSVDPAVVTVGMIQAGKASNVIPDTCEMSGTVRSFNNDRRQMLAKRIQEIAIGVAASLGATATVDYDFGYPPTVNDVEMTEMVRAVAAQVVGEDRVHTSPLIMGAEDFSYFLEHRPGCFFFVGSKNEEKGLVWGHHHPRFDIDEESMAVGMETMARSVVAYLNG